MLTEFDLQNTKIQKVPMDMHDKLTPTSGDPSWDPILIKDYMGS